MIAATPLVFASMSGGAAALMGTKVPPGDGRSLRATGRTKNFGTAVSEEFHRELRMYAAAHDLKIVEVLELGLAALKERERLGLPPLKNPYVP